MRELRTCPLTGTVVLLNDAWVERPPAPRAPPSPCPWCAFEGPVITRRGDWRACPHPTPALGVEGSVELRVGHGRVARDALGVHEVLVGPHEGAAAEALALGAERVADLRGDRRLGELRLVRRDRPGAHAAWQLLGLPWALPNGDVAAWRDAELADGARLVGVHDGVGAVLAWAPRVPFELWIVPTSGREGLAGADAGAALLGPSLARLRRALGPVDIDVVVIDGAPWRIELLPRLRAPWPGEVALGVPHHGVVPEVAAAYLRARPTEAG